ncbi:MAG: PRTRC system protein E [Parabacteroides gordonii]|nr:PRTRC system protein E [Parabacteroides gordonii]
MKRNGNEMIVSVLPRIKDLKDEAAKKLVPLVVSGTPDELDKGFSAAISNPIQEATGLLLNMKDFEKSVSKAQGSSKIADANKKKYDQLVKKAEELEKSKKLKSAIACLSEAMPYATDKPALKVRIDKLKAKQGAGSLFGADEDEAIPESFLGDELESGNDPEANEDDEKWHR